MFQNAHIYGFVRFLIKKYVKYTKLLADIYNFYYLCSQIKKRIENHA